MLYVAVELVTKHSCTSAQAAEDGLGMLMTAPATAHIASARRECLDNVAVASAEAVHNSFSALSCCICSAKSWTN